MPITMPMPVAAIPYNKLFATPAPASAALL
jgi:hypothetical protein